MINDCDLVRATAKRERQERLLYYADFAGECMTKVLQHYESANEDELFTKLGFYNPKRIWPVRKADAPVFDYSSYFKGVKIPENVRIEKDGILNLPGSTHHFTHLISPLRDVFEMDEIMEFPIYNKPEYYDYSTLKGQVVELHDKNLVASAWCGRLFEASWPLRGYENLLADMMIDVDVADYFFDMQLNLNLVNTSESALAGADILYFGDDVGNQNGMTFSSEMWRKMLKPRWARIFETAKKINPDIVLWYHSCGNITEIIPDLIEIGLDILNPIQPECMDIYEIHRKYGNDISFDGGLGTQSVMPFGSADEVIAHTKQLFDVFGANGGLILAPSHVVEPEVPMENIVAYIKTAQDLCIRK